MKPSILVVDDEEMVRRFICEELATADYAVSEATDALSAIALLQQESFQVVVTDKNMPGTQNANEGGFDVLRFAKKINPACGVIMMTGYASVESAIEAMRLGAFDYVGKPIKFGELKEKIARVIFYQRALNPAANLTAYESFWRDYMEIVEENKDIKRCLCRGQNVNLFKSMQRNLDMFFQERNVREHFILEERDALLKIVSLASQLKEMLGADSAESALVDLIIEETERRL
ncbi:MAG: response regulator [Desulfobulbaceae bacterium]|nr:response regulator [Desulfobulbaceae bacterium]HIJ89508.1 response regulator [Deltaproteobacteria bacterium]